MEGHHLILGELQDMITGETLPDTLDERYRQKLMRILIEDRGYARSDIQCRNRLDVHAGGACAVVNVDIAVRINDTICMIVKFGPGSLVTRHRPAIATSRLLTPYQIPVVVVTNGEDADILDGDTGAVLAGGLDNIPSRSELGEHFQEYTFRPISGKRAEIESRIVYAYEVDGACPCDTSICRIQGQDRP